MAGPASTEAPRLWFVCPLCKKERQADERGRLLTHRRWDGRRMIYCNASGRRAETPAIPEDEPESPPRTRARRGVHAVVVEDTGIL